MRTPEQDIRDAALNRLRQLTRTLCVAAVVGAGVLVDTVGHTAYGRAHKRLATGTLSPESSATLGATTAAPAASQPTQAAPTQAAPTQAAPTQAAPTQVQPTQSAPVVQSGGS